MISRTNLRVCFSVAFETAASTVFAGRVAGAVREKREGQVGVVEVAGRLGEGTRQLQDMERGPGEFGSSVVVPRGKSL